MAQPVWVLSVDLQTKTATFQSGLSDAAKAARGSFTEIKAGADDMGRATSGSMMEARHGVMLLGEEFGVHLPRGITSFITSLGPVAAAMEMAFPFLAIAVGATLLLEHLNKIHEAAEKAANAQAAMGTSAAKALRGLDDELLSVGIQMDELNGNHLGALRKELARINDASLDKLEATFNIFAKSADAALAELKTSWYQFGAGSAGAKNSLDQFKQSYDALLAQGKDTEALASLDAKVAREREILRLQQQAQSSQTHIGGDNQKGNYVKFEEAKVALQKLGVGYTEKETQAQQDLVAALNNQLTATSRINELKKQQGALAEAHTDKTMGAEDDKKWRDLGREAKQEADDAEKAWDLAYRAAVSKLQESEKEKIDATRQGSQARLAAIDAAIKEEQSKGLQDTAYYKSLEQDKVNTTREMEEERLRINAEVGKEIAETVQRMGLLAVAAEQEQNAHRAAMHHVSDSIRLAEAQKVEQEEYAIKQAAFESEIAALDKNAKDYQAKLRQLQDREQELTQEHQNKLTQIADRAEQERNTRILAAESRLDDSVAKGLTGMLTKHESFAKMMNQIGGQVASGMMETAIKSVLANDFTKESDAAAAARKAYLAGMNFPFPVNVVMGPALGAMAFASVMAFEGGGIVPGVGKGDSTPAMLTPGEAVLPKNLTEGLTSAARGGNLGGGHSTTVHLHQTNHLHAIDADGVGKMLEDHGEKFTNHVTRELRKRNE
jgi:hypothetical protein